MEEERLGGGGKRGELGQGEVGEAGEQVQQGGEDPVLPGLRGQLCGGAECQMGEQRGLADSGQGRELGTARADHCHH